MANESARCPGCQRLPLQVREHGACAECDKSRNAQPERCVWRRLREEAPPEVVTTATPQPQEPPDAPPVPPPVPPDAGSATGTVKPDPNEASLLDAQKRLAELEDSLRNEQLAAEAERKKADDHRSIAEKLAQQITGLQQESERLRSEVAGHRQEAAAVNEKHSLLDTAKRELESVHAKALDVHHRILESLRQKVADLQQEAEKLRLEAQSHRQEADNQRSAAQDAAAKAQAISEKHSLLDTAKRELESVHAKALTQIEQLNIAHADAQRSNTDLQAALGKTQEALQSSRINIAQQVAAGTRTRRWLTAGIGALTGMTMGAAGTWALLPKQIAASPVNVHMVQLLTQANTCLLSEDWFCVGISAARMLAMDPRSPVALVAQREARIAQQQSDTAEQQKKTEQELHARQAKLTAQNQALPSARQSPGQPACPSTPTSSTLASTDAAIAAALAQQRTGVMTQLMRKAEAARAKSAFDCAEDLAVTAQSYESNASIDRFIAGVRTERQRLLNNGVVIRQ
ncbi:hypothetical protein M0D69_16900 [Caballeronia sp. SEWSISQ10-4 2]|uniref:hypothetical protein n=1 Tax=Caballeronia sp. SEWSISQ10-4 2 TaxID=2937438 RepID=UPI0026520B47|nr:hypothetical protein [Caballeronia sp. SEWSISQ10-4 2]MDN7179636.1 hypothetical protein [Caballeronia sp. SEWSISQ10-4 2]